MPLPPHDPTRLFAYQGDKLLGPVEPLEPDEGSMYLTVVVDADVDRLVDRVDVYEQPEGGERRHVCGINVRNVSQPVKGKPTRITGTRR